MAKLPSAKAFAAILLIGGPSVATFLDSHVNAYKVGQQLRDIEGSALGNVMVAYGAGPMSTYVEGMFGNAENAGGDQGAVATDATTWLSSFGGTIHDGSLIQRGGDIAITLAGTPGVIASSLTSWVSFNAGRDSDAPRPEPASAIIEGAPSVR